ncbi:MAG: hypothetical protein WC974_01375 [Thermoplasmata archaeon]
MNNRIDIRMNVIALSGIILLICVALIGNLLLTGNAPTVKPGTDASFGEALWKDRSLDVFGQILIIFAGVLGVMALFRKGGEEWD